MLTIVMIISTIAVTILSTASFSSQQVSISLIPNPKIDIVLAKARTNTNVTNFETDILNALKTKNINTDNVKVSSIEAQEVNIEESFSWNQDLDSSIGSIEITNNGQNVVMKGNTSKPGKNAIWIMPNEGQEQKFTFDYNVNFGDSFDAAGMLLRVKEMPNNTLQGYMLSFNYSGAYGGADFYNTAKSISAIWKFTYDMNNATAMPTGTSKELVQTLNINTSGTLTVEATDSEIKISGGGLSETTVCEIDPDYETGNGFGFCSVHYSHNCEKIGGFTLENINLKTTVVKKFSEVLRQPEWRDESIKVLVNISDYSNDELKDNSSLSELLTRLLNENIHFVSWGNSTNKTQFENLIKANNNKGKYINNTSYNSSISQTATYIKKLVDELTPNDQYVILGDPISVNVNPESVKNNTADTHYPYGKWKITHDFEYYENNIGQFSESGKYVNNFIDTFDKTGKYQILYEDTAVVPENIYVHRRPTAQILLRRSGNSITLTSESYDLDSYTSGNRGISQEEWKYKKATDTSWTSGKLTTITGEDDYIVQLRVKDYQNTWSNPDSKYITNSVNALPVASFSLKSETITRYDNLEIVDSSYDPAGGTISSRSWEVYKGDKQIYKGTTPPTNYRTQGVGSYSIYLTVTNSRGKTSERFGRTFTVIEDKIAPEVVVTPTECSWSNSVTVNLSFSDKGGSQFKQYQYAITDSQSTPTSWSSAITKASDSITITQEGIKYLHIKAQDNAENISEDRVVGPFRIDRTNPIINYAGDLTNTKIDYVDIKLEATDTLSGIKSFTLNGNPISNQTYRFAENGTYQLVATDVAGHSSTVNLVINNIYYNCTAGLEHPIYSSSYDECPICNSYKGLQVTESSHVYNAKAQGVKYNNPKNASIVEYYSGSTTKKIQHGSYPYELKVVYNGKQYKTGVTGTYTIDQRHLTIDHITANNRVYDRDNYEIGIQGGELHNLLANNPDNIGFTLNGAYVENNQAGNQTVKIREIQLTNNQKQNYVLEQPSDIQVDILKDKLTITGIKAQDRQYDGTNVVELLEGALLGIQEGDNVSFNLPETGTAENKNIGEHKVQVPEITLTGDQASNYYLVQPTYGAVKATITPRVLTIDGITAISPVYDRENAEIRIQNGVLHNLLENNPDNIGFTLQGAYVENNHAGEQVVKINEVLLTNNETGNYTLIQPADISVEIRAKELTIIDIVTKDRIYDGTKIVELSGGKLVGVCNGDKVRFNMPETGEIENKNVGSWKVTIDTISLEGEDIANYVIKQPEYGTVIAEITQRPLKVVELAGKNKIYDGNKTVEIIGGKLDGYIENDNVFFDVPSTGETESEKAGTWNVSIEPITLKGEDVPNYEFTQPEEGEIKATISTESGQLKIGCNDKIYDRKVIEPYVIEKNSTAEVEYTYYKSGTDEKVEQPYDVGVYDVIGYIPTDGNYTEANSAKVTFKIKNPEEPLLQLKSRIISVNNKEISTEEKFKVNYRDEIEIKIEIDNSGKGNGYAQKVITRLPDGIELAKDNEINKENGWQELERGVVETTKLSLENNIDNEIFSSKENLDDKEDDTSKDQKDQEGIEEDTLKDNQEDTETIKTPEETGEKPETPEGSKEEPEQKEKITKQTLKLVLKVTDTSKQEKDITINNEVVQQNIRGDVVPYTNGTQDKGKSQDNVQLEYLDFEVEKKIVKIIETDTSTGAKKTYDIQQKPKQIIKIDLKSSKIGHTKLEVVYQINVTNKGNKSGKVDKIIDILPAGVDFKVAENPGWSIDSEGNISYEQMSEEIKPNETKQAELKLNWNVTSGNLSARTNYAMVQASDELDEILVKENRAVITQTNNYNGSEMIVSIVTGQMVALWLTLTGVCIAVIAGGVALIKKYVVFK